VTQIYSTCDQPDKIHSALLLDEQTDFFRGGKDDKCAITPHACTEDSRLSLIGTVFTRVGFEPQIKLPERVGITTAEGNEVGVGAVTNGSDALWWTLSLLAAHAARSLVNSQNLLP
jgi:hypothetical protein